MTRIFFLLLLSYLSACKDSGAGKEPVTPGKTSSAEWKHLDEPGYSARYPSDWQLSREPGPGIKFIVLSPLESKKDKFRENVNLMIQDLRGQNMDLDKYTEVSTRQMEQMAREYEPIESRRVKKGPLEYHKLIYAAYAENLNLQFEQYYLIVDQTAWVMTLTCEKSEFEKFRETGERILNSFELKR